MIKHSKLRKIYGLILKTAIIIIAYGFIYKQIFHTRGLDDIYNSFKDLSLSFFFSYKLLLVFVLMFFNWGIESLKWNFLIRKIEKISFIKSFKAVLSGVTVSTFTPNRVGEFFGRVFVLEKANHWEGIFITVIGSMSQLLITIVMGLISIILFIPQYIKIEEYFPIYFYYGFVFIAIALIILLLFLFFNISLLTSLVNKLKFKGSGKIKKYIKVFSAYSSNELFKVLLLSFVRYSIFTIQFYLLFLFFHVDIPFIDGMMLISLIFFIMTAIPTIALSELGVRGSTAIAVIGLYFGKFNTLSDDIELFIMASATTLWLINLVIPALMGSLFIFNLKFFRKKN
jgi:uncharacterized membrane protein YbhN (UPF0104 family)